MAIHRSTALLDELAAIAGRYGRGMPKKKAALLDGLVSEVLPTARKVSRLHELLLLLRAYPDDAAVLERVSSMLDGFADRRDLQRFSEDLADTGIAGTPLHYRFYWGMAEWLAQHWPALLQVDWAEVNDDDALERLLQILVLYCETPALDTMDLSAREWFQRLKGSDETDATFLVQRFAALPTDAFGREVLYDSLDMPLRLDAGHDTPSRTKSRYSWRPTVYQTRARKRRRPALARAAHKPPLSVKSVSRDVGVRLIDLAREAMVTRQRDLDGINWADPDNATLIDAGEGLSFVCLGLRPERRLMLEAVHIFLILKNGVPVGYFQSATLFGASELNYNLFAPWRGAEAAVIYARGVAVVRHLLGSDVFAIDPSQIGDGNPEAIRTGAFWFYYKLGFRPEDAYRRDIVREERAAMKQNPKHRSDRATLLELSGDYLFFYLDGRRDDVVGKLHYGNVGLAVSTYVSQRFGADRETATKTCSAEARDRLGLASLKKFNAGERIAWARWSPLVMVLDEAASWSVKDKRSFVDVIRAKGGRCERTYVQRFDQHRKLRSALAKLAREP
jgi:hypothetical protein